MHEHKPATKNESPTTPTEDEVGREAYAIYLKEGRPSGRARQNWAEAEARLRPAGSNHAGHTDHAEHHGAPNHHDHHDHMAADFRNRFWISLVLTLPILVLSPMLQALVGLREAIHFPGDLYVLFGFASAVFWYGGWPFLKRFFEEIKARRPGMMTLISVAVATAYLYSGAVVFGLTGKMFFWELATLVDIMLLGHWIEMKSVMGASKALDELAKLMPSDAHKFMPDGSVKDVPLGELAVNDKVLIKPGEKIPADGTITAGESSVNEAMLTGESTPTAKKTGGRVIGGSVNGEGSLTVEVKGTGKDSFLSQADVGIAIGAGSDVAVETADVILVRSNPLDVVTIVQLSRATYRKMIQNLVWTTGYNVVAIPLAAGALFAWGVLLTPALGAGLMAVSTVVVAINARLLTVKPREAQPTQSP